MRGRRGSGEGRGEAEVRALGQVLTELMARPALARGIPVGRLARVWGEVVGPRLAGQTFPARMEGGTLVVGATTGPWGAQARFLAGEIRRRCNEVLGGETVKRVRVVVAEERPQPRRDAAGRGEEGDTDRGPFR